MAVDSKAVARQLSNNGYSSSEAAGTAPATSIQGSGLNLSGDSQRILSSAENIAANSNNPNIDKTYVNQLKMQQAAANASKRTLALGLTKNLGQFRDRIAQNNLEKRQKMASSGFIGAGAQARETVDQNTMLRNTLGEQENQFTGKLRDLNNQVMSSRQAEIEALRPTMGEAVAREAAINTVSGKSAAEGGQVLGGLKKDSNVLKDFLSVFGGNVDYKGTINSTAFKNSEYYQNIGKELGINVGSEDFVQEVNNKVGNIITGREGSKWDTTKDIFVDLGNGPQKIGEQSKSIGQAILDGITGVLDVGLVAAGAVAGVIIPLGGAVAAGMEAAVSGMGALAAEDIASSLGVEAVSSLGAEAGSSSLSEMVAESFGNSFAEVGGGQLSGQTLKSGIATTLETNFGEEMANVSLATANTAKSVGTKTMQLALEQGATIDEAVGAATNNAMNVIANNEAVTSLAVVNSTEALESGGIEALQQAGSEAAQEIYSAGATAAGEGATAVEGQAAAVEGADATVAGEGQAAVEGQTATGSQAAAEGQGSIIGAVKNKYPKITSATEKLLKGTFGSAFKIVKNTGKFMFKTKTGLTLTLSATGATILSSIIDNATEQDLKDAKFKDALEEIIKRYGEENNG